VINSGRRAGHPGWCRVPQLLSIRFSSLVVVIEAVERPPPRKT
jgi:hypothetical protein